MRKRISLVLVALFLAACEPSFSEEDIERAKASIRAEYEKQRGVKVIDVALIKVSPTKLTGFVKLRASGSSTERMLDCSAAMGMDRKYIWQCGK